MKKLLAKFSIGWRASDPISVPEAVPSLPHVRPLSCQGNEELPGPQALADSPEIPDGIMQEDLRSRAKRGRHWPLPQFLQVGCLQNNHPATNGHVCQANLGAWHHPIPLL